MEDIERLNREDTGGNIASIQGNSNFISIKDNCLILPS
jgi:hypothetical protein